MGRTPGAMPLSRNLIYSTVKVLASFRYHELFTYDSVTGRTEENMATDTEVN